MENSAFSTQIEFSVATAEWAIPHSDFFEGLVGVKGGYFQNENLMRETGGISIPLFEMVYRDTVALYGKYCFDISKVADMVLYHIRIARPLYYHNRPDHLYWKEKAVEPPSGSGSAPDPALFTRADHGWAEGMHPYDRFLKNTYEILSPLNELTAQSQMTEFEFLDSDHATTKTVFRQGSERVEAIVNGSRKTFRWQSGFGGEVVLPPQGFVVDAPSFVAFHALQWNGLRYDSAPLFTVRSLDAKPLSESSTVRVYHGFGDSRIKIGGAVHSVQREGHLIPANQRAGL